MINHKIKMPINAKNENIKSKVKAMISRSWKVDACDYDKKDKTSNHESKGE